MSYYHRNLYMVTVRMFQLGGGGRGGVPGTRTKRKLKSEILVRVKRAFINHVKSS